MQSHYPVSKSAFGRTARLEEHLLLFTVGLYMMLYLCDVMYVLFLLFERDNVCPCWRCPMQWRSEGGRDSLNKLQSA